MLFSVIKDDFLRYIRDVPYSVYECLRNVSKFLALETLRCSQLWDMLMRSLGGL